MQIRQIAGSVLLPSGDVPGLVGFRPFGLVGAAVARGAGASRVMLVVLPFTVLRVVTGARVAAVFPVVLAAGLLATCAPVFLGGVGAADFFAPALLFAATFAVLALDAGFEAAFGAATVLDFAGFETDDFVTAGLAAALLAVFGPAVTAGVVAVFDAVFLPASRGGAGFAAPALLAGLAGAVFGAAVLLGTRMAKA